MTRRVGAVTVARSDYGIYRSIFDAIRSDPALELGLFVGAAHLSPEFGMTVSEIKKSGDPIVGQVEMLLNGDSAESVSKAMGLGMLGFAQAYSAWRPDILLVLGDRFEMFAATAAAVPFNIPIAHLHGGELTYGAIDDSMRHAITKLAHLHFTATQDYANRVISMGEIPENVLVSGAPSLDRIRSSAFSEREKVEQQFGITLTPAPLLCTFHPVSREFEQARVQTETLCDALDRIDVPVIFTMPNADTGGKAVRAALQAYKLRRPSIHLIENFGFKNYFTVMCHACAIVGNSSSALIEAPSFGLPAVNIGRRQEGRTRGMNIIDVPCETTAICEALEVALSLDFRTKAAEAPNPYGDGQAAEKIVKVLRETPLGRDLIFKRFHDDVASSPLIG